eukprot:jgi/Orpsp1_1/1191694/evm.model.d7180000087889.1
MGLLSLVASSFAVKNEVSNDCTEIKTYLENNKIDYLDSIDKCEVNDEGKVTY